MPRRSANPTTPHAYARHAHTPIRLPLKRGERPAHISIALYKSGGEVLGPLPNPHIDHVELKKSAGFDLMLVPREGAIMDPGISLDKLVTRNLGGRDPAQIREPSRYPKFFLQLAHRAIPI